MATTRRKKRPAPSPAKHPNATVIPEGRRPCPICGRSMTTQRRADAAIDVCPDHGIWLDRGELERMFLRRARAAGRRIRRARRLAWLYWTMWP